MDVSLEKLKIRKIKVKRKIYILIKKKKYILIKKRNKK